MFQRPWTRAARILALAISIVAGGCRREKPVEAQAVRPELKLEGVRFRVYRGGELLAFGKADRATLRRDSTDLAAADLEAVLPRSVPPVRIAAPAGAGVLKSRVFSLSGGVTALRGDDVARTASARFVPGPGGGEVVGEDPIDVEGKAYRLTGTGFTVDPSSAELEIHGRPRLVAGEGARE